MSDRSAASPIAAIAGWLCLALVLTGLGLYLVAGEELSRMIILVLQVGGVTLIVGLVAVTFIGLGYALWVAYQRGQAALEARLAAAAQRQIIEAQALRERRQAEVLVVTARADEQIFIRDTAHGLWRAGHLDPRIYANGLPSLPSGLELAAWQAFHRPVAAPGSPALAEPPALAAGLWPPQVNLLDLLPPTGASLSQIALGVTLTPTGLETVRAPLPDLVHIAIGGSSGWGKSIMLRTLAFQIATATEPCDLVCLDLEGITFAPFARSARLRYAIADTESDALAILADLVAEMNRRRELFSAYPGCDSLGSYNALAGEPLPTIAVLVDESTALLSDKTVESAIRTLTLRARKFGVYAILGGQDWKAASLDTAIRNQLSSRIQFKAQDGAQSRVLLGAPDAAHLDRPGRAYALLPGRPAWSCRPPLSTSPPWPGNCRLGRLSPNDRGRSPHRQPTRSAGCWNWPLPGPPRPKFVNRSGAINPANCILKLRPFCRNLRPCPVHRVHHRRKNPIFRSARGTCTPIKQKLSGETIMMANADNREADVLRKLGIDPGFGNIKIGEVQAGSLATFSLPSQVGIARERKEGLTLAGMVKPTRRSRTPFRVEFEGAEWLVGPGVADYTRPINRLDFDRFSDSPELRATLYAALYQMVNGGPHRLAVAMALPVEVVQDKTEAEQVERGVKSWLSGRHAFSVGLANRPAASAAPPDDPGHLRNDGSPYHRLPRRPSHHRPGPHPNGPGMAGKPAAPPHPHHPDPLPRPGGQPELWPGPDGCPVANL
jgi:hypothetical protein